MTFHSIKDVPREEYIAAGTAACGGCGGMEVLRLANKVLGEKVIFVNAAGCFSLLALYPFAADVYSVSVLRDTLIFLCLGNGNGAYRCRRGRNPSPMLAESVLQQAGVEAHE